MTAAGVSPTRSWLLLLAYLPVLGLIPFAFEKNDPEIRWHARNGLLLFAAAAAAALFATLVGVVVPAFTCFYAAAIFVVLLLYVSISVLAIVMALTGRRLMIPWISRRASRLAGSL